MSNDFGAKAKSYFDALESARLLGNEVFSSLFSIAKSAQLPDGYRILRHRLSSKDGEPYVSLHITTPEDVYLTTDALNVNDIDPTRRHESKQIKRMLQELSDTLKINFIPEEIPLEELHVDYLDP